MITYGLQKKEEINKKKEKKIKKRKEKKRKKRKKSHASPVGCEAVS